MYRRAMFKALGFLVSTPAVASSIPSERQIPSAPPPPTPSVHNGGPPLLLTDVLHGHRIELELHGGSDREISAPWYTRPVIDMRLHEVHENGDATYSNPTEISWMVTTPAYISWARFVCCGSDVAGGVQLGMNVALGDTLTFRPGHAKLRVPAFLIPPYKTGT